jgi:hypothetical protein
MQQYFMGPQHRLWTLGASFSIRFGPIASNLSTSVSQKAVCDGVPSHMDHEVAVAQCNVILRTHMEDNKE